MRRSRLAAEVLRFGVVGAVGYSSDVVAFNLLRGVLGWNPILAKAVSLTISTTVAYVGNRFWTYRERRADGRTTRQYILFYLVNGLGAGMELVLLWFSHDVLGFRSLLADNISGNVVGMAAATLFRFWGYRTLVFREAAAGTDARLEPLDTMPLPPEGVPEATDSVTL